MPVSTQQGIHYQFIDNPGKPTVVLAHPLGMNMQVWDYLVPDLTTNFSILRFDLAGHGSSTPYSADTTSLEDSRLVDDLLQLCDELGIATFHFVGTSIGGMLGQQLLASASEHLLSATLTNTGMKIGSREGWLDRQAKVMQESLSTLAPSLVTRWFSPQSTERYPNLLSQWASLLARTDDHSYGLLCAWLGEQDMSESLKATDIPVLLVAGEDDVATPTSDLIALGKALNKPVAELKQTGHVPSLESSREFTQLVRDHLTSVK